MDLHKEPSLWNMSAISATSAAFLIKYFKYRQDGILKPVIAGLFESNVGY